MFPAQALAEAMLAKGWRVKLSTDERGARFTAGFPKDVEIEIVPSATFAHSGLLTKLRVPFRLMRGVLSARKKMKRDRPAVVVGFGGYPAIPAMVAAISLKLPRMIHEQNGVLGRVNQILVSRVDAVACGTWPTELPDGILGMEVGNPVRQAVLDKHGADYIAPGEYPMSILVMGGSQGAKILSDVVPQAIALLPQALRQHLRIDQQARAEDVERVSEAYDAQGVPSTVQPFFDDIPKRMSETQLVISRSGASSVADISVIGRPAIFVPLKAAIRDEQTANARELTKAEAAVTLSEDQFTPKAVSDVILAIFNAPEAATNMARAALDCARPSATETLVDLVESLSGDAQ